MWTPRRIFLVVVGLMLFGLVYTGYAKMLGWVDGLPPLPEEYSRAMTDGETPIPPFIPTTLQSRLRQAFGPNCIEQHVYPIKLEIRDKGILFAAMESKILPDGRVQFNQLSVAVFGKNQEISTLHCDWAVLEFDAPVRKIEDMGSRKVWATDLHADPDYPTNDPRKGKVHITNNRRTPNDPNDDLIVKSPGPIFYRDDPNRPLASNALPPPRHPSIPTRLPHIWSYSHVELLDKQNRPGQQQTDMTVPLNTVTADGMRMYLTVETVAAEPPKKGEKNNGSKVSGVDRIDLDRNVLMHLWSDNSSMFGDKSAPSQPVQPAPVSKATRAPPPPPAVKSLIKIQTDGSFYYDMRKDYSHFERPDPDPQIPKCITVTRYGKGIDTLSCDYLDIQFRRKKPTDPPPAAKGKGNVAAAPKAAPPVDNSRQEADMDMEWVHAWGKDIAISSEAEKLDAYGYDLVFDANAQQTVLKGHPMRAVKENNQIKAKELILSELNDREKQKARAIGPGDIGMGEYDEKTKDYSRRALWQHELHMQRVKENGKDYDLLLLTGGAEFRDTQNAQSLSGRQLKLWLIPDKSSSEKSATDKPAAKKVAKIDPKKTEEPKEEHKQPLPYRLEATGQVRAYSAEMIIHDADYLDVWFKDVPAAVETAPMPGEKSKNPAPMIPGDPLFPPPLQVDGGPKKQDVPAGPKKAVAKKDEPKKDEPVRVPIELRHSRRVITWVNRTDGKNDLDRVHCEGKVVITQKPTPENKNGVRIEGTTVDMEHYLEGNNLMVVGNEEIVGQVHFDTIAIVADDIHIDQRRNEARVKGRGWMQLQSATKLVDDAGKKETEKTKQTAKKQPDKPEEKAPPIEIEWDDNMELEGPSCMVTFVGNVVATQKEGSVNCENMQVKLDRPVWLNSANKPPAKPGEPNESPKVERILCDQAVEQIKNQKPRETKPVAMQDQELLNGKIIKFQRVEGTTINMDNERNIVITEGPAGKARIFQAGSRDPLGDAGPQGKKDPVAANNGKPMPQVKNDPRAKDNGKSAPKGNANKDDEVMKLTLIDFKGRMTAYNKERKAVFKDNIDLTHFPSERHDVVLKPGDPLPEEGMHIFCQESLELQTFSRMMRDENGKEFEYKWQEMKGEGNVNVRSEDYTGWATRMTYSEEKGLLIFYGDTLNQIPATLTQATGKGLERKKYQGAQIKYWTKTKDIEVVGGLGGVGN